MCVFIDMQHLISVGRIMNLLIPAWISKEQLSGFDPFLLVPDNVGLTLSFHR